MIRMLSGIYLIKHNKKIAQYLKLPTRQNARVDGL